MVVTRFFSAWQGAFNVSFRRHRLKTSCIGTTCGAFKRTISTWPWMFLQRWSHQLHSHHGVVFFDTKIIDLEAGRGPNRWKRKAPSNWPPLHQGSPAKALEAWPQPWRHGVVMSHGMPCQPCPWCAPNLVDKLRMLGILNYGIIQAAHIPLNSSFVSLQFAYVSFLQSPEERKVAWQFLMNRPLSLTSSFSATSRSLK